MLLSKYYALMAKGNAITKSKKVDSLLFISLKQARKSLDNKMCLVKMRLHDNVDVILGKRSLCA